MKIDRFTWIVLAVVVLILVGAIVSVNLTGGAGVVTEDYLEEDSPATPVYNAFLAFQNGDVQMARRQYTTRVLDDELRETGYNPFADRFSQSSARRLRIVEIDYDEQNPDHAYVTADIDSYQSSGPFGAGSTWTRRVVLDVVRESGEAETESGAGDWKLDTLEFFY